jgi:DNA-binding MarR family transcriptional regulator
MTRKTELESLFLRKKPVKLIVSLNAEKKKYVTVVAKEIDCTYSHVVKLLDLLKKLGIVNYEKEGRVKFVSLTEEGKEIAKIFESLLKRFSKLETQIEKPQEKQTENKK